MKNKKIKAIVAGVALTVCVVLSSVFCGCIAGKGRDGINGKDLNIFDIYEAAKAQTGNPDLTFEEFLREYLSYNSSELEEATSLRASVNKSLMSAVSIRADFSYPDSMSIYSNTGSGVIVDIDVAKGDMTVVTNCHVVYNAHAVGDKYSDTIRLWLYGSESYYTKVNADNAIEAKIIGASKNYDLAVLQVKGNDLVKRSKAKSANWSKSEENYLGETVYAIGNPTIGNGEFGMMSANVGYISKDLESVSVDLGDPTFYTYNVLRTSTPINSGNSGGGLYNYAGELVGIVNAKGRDDAIGVGYALPASTVKRVVKRMISDSDGTEKHDVRLVKSGIEITVTDSYSTGLNDKGLAEIYEQVTVWGVDPGAALGVIKTGDIIKHVKIMREQGIIEDLDIMREHNFTDVMLSVEAGDLILITVLRGGVELSSPLQITYSASDFEKLV